MCPPSGKVLRFPSSHSFYLNNSPLVRAGNALAAVVELVWRSISTWSIAGAAESIERDMLKDVRDTERPQGIAQL